MNNQMLAFEKFSKLKVGAVFMKMGSGKTKIAIDLINYNINKIDMALFIAPHSTLSNLDMEIRKWGINCQYIIKSYESISMSNKKYIELINAIKNKKVFIVADESIFIKNEGSIRFNRLCNIRNSCEYALILNGTPLVKNEWDLYNQMYFLSPLIINMGRNEFLNNFFKHIVYKKRGEKEKSFYKFSEVNAEYLTRLIAPYVFYSDLEIKIDEQIQTFKITPNDETLTKYIYYKKFLLENLKDNNVILGNLQMLLKASADDRAKAKRIAEYTKGKQIIVYCQFKSEIDNIKEELKNDCLIITGDTLHGQRQGIIDEFQKNNKPLLMTLGTGAFGLNLQFCNEIVYSSISFDYGKIEQSRYRIKRIGQKRKIIYSYFKTGLGIEQLSQECIDKKMTLSNLIKGGVENWKKYI